MATVADMILKYLENEGVEYVFGISGAALNNFLVAFNRNPRLKPIVAKHEGGAAFMADGYARVSGRLGACYATSGPGATNLVTGVATSFTDNVPVIVFTGQVSLMDYGKGTFQDSTRQGVDAVAIFAPITKSSSMILSKYKAEDEIRDAIRKAMTGRRGPVHLSLPKDVVGAELKSEFATAPTQKFAQAYFDRDLTITAARKLVEAKHPAILVGSGAVTSGACASIVELAELLGIPVATTPKAKGAFPEDHPLSLGVFGFCGTPMSEARIKSGQTDVLLVVGSSLTQMTTLSWDPKMRPSDCFIHINIDPTEIGRSYHADVPLVGDALTVIDEIAFRSLRYLDQLGDRKGQREAEVRALREKFGRYVNPEKMTSNETPLHPARLIKDLEAGLPDDAILFSDTGNHTDWAIHYLTVKRPGSFIAPFGMLPMGYATAAAVGGKLAAPDRPVVALVGDGCFMMNGMEVATAVCYDIPVVWVVMNNAKLGMAYDIQTMVGIEHPVGSDFKPVNCAKIAEGMGAVGIRITNPGQLAVELPKAIASGKPTVFDCVISKDYIPPLAPYIDGQKEYVRRMLTL